MCEVIAFGPGGYDRTRSSPSRKAGQAACAEDGPPLGLVDYAMLAAGLALHVTTAWGLVRGLA
jgi:hypothetical protein